MALIYKILDDTEENYLEILVSEKEIEISVGALDTNSQLFLCFTELNAEKFSKQIEFLVAASEEL